MIKFFKGAGILFISEDESNELEFFLAKRVNFPVCWSIPAGGYDNDDGSLWKCARRETKEEIGIQLEKNHTHFIEYKQNTKLLYEWSTFVVKVNKDFFDKNYRLGGEFSEGGWFKDLPPNSHFMLKSIIKDLKENKPKLKKSRIKKNLLNIMEQKFKLLTNFKNPK